MPTYDYQCPNGHRFEVFQRMSDEPAAACPECGAAAERLISGGAGFLFKGEGFYITDYRSDEYRKKATAEKGDGGGSPKTGDSGAGDKGGGSEGTSSGGSKGTGGAGKSADD